MPCHTVDKSKIIVSSLPDYAVKLFCHQRSGAKSDYERVNQHDGQGERKLMNFGKMCDWVTHIYKKNGMVCESDILHLFHISGLRACLIGKYICCCCCCFLYDEVLYNNPLHLQRSPYDLNEVSP